MKKLFVSVLAIAGLVACNTEDVVRVQGPEAIRFEGTFVENATRSEDPSTTTANIQEFSVWAYMNEANGIVFDDELVSRNGDAWSYTNTQYWLAGNDYRFAAFAGDRNDVKGLPATMATDGLGEITFTNVNGTNDILYAEQFVVNAANDQEAVELQFAHLLSKVKFSFKNGFANDNNYVQVENIEMTVPAEGKVVLSTANYDAHEYIWTDHVDGLTLNFGDIAKAKKLDIREGDSSDYERLTIPANAERKYVITFEVSVWNGEQEGIDNRKMTVEMSGLELLAGHAYNFVATINQENLDLNAIEFEVKVDKWEEHEFDGGAVQDEVKFVSTAEELQAALDANIPHICLGANIDGDVTIEQKPGVHVVINGNGFEYMGTMIVDGKSSTTTDKSLVIRDVNFVTEETEMDFISSSNDPVRYARNITIENCTFTAPKGSDVVAMRLRQSYNIVVKGCTMNGGHSLAQITSNNSGITFENCTVESGRGINLGNAINDGAANVINCNINATKDDGYGVRIDAKGAETLNVVGGTIEAYEPIVLRNAQSAFTFNIEGTELISKGKYQIVVLGAYPKMNGVEGYTVAYSVSAANFAAALADENVKVVDAASDIAYADSMTITSDKAINFNGNTLSVADGQVSGYGARITNGASVEFNEANIVSGGAGLNITAGADVVFNGGSIVSNSDTNSGQRYLFYVAQEGSTATINGGSFSFTNVYRKVAYICADWGAVVYVTGGEFGAPCQHPSWKEPIVTANGGQVIITGGTFGFNPSAWVAEGYVATQNGSTWTVAAE